MTTAISVKEKIHIVKLYYALDEKVPDVQRKIYEEGVESGKFNPKHGIHDKRNPVPTLRAIRKIVSVFAETGCVDRTLLKSHTREKTVTGIAENIQRVKEEVTRSPGVSKSTCRLSEILQLKQSAVYRILKDLHLKPYIPRLHQKLSECDFDSPVEFREH